MKRNLSVALVLALTLSLTGCGASAGSSPTTASPTVETTVDTSPVTSAAPEVDMNEETTAEQVNSDEAAAIADTGSLDSIATNSLLQAINRRNSTARDDFSGKEIDEDLFRLLGWAATGRNREGTGFVVPLAMGAEPYVSLYLVQESGVRRFLWEDNSFEIVLEDDIRSQVAMLDIEGAYAYWIYVIDLELVPMNNVTWGYHAVGAMSEHQYLVAEAFDVQVRYMAAVNAENVIELLGFNAEEKLPVGVMVMAHK